MAKSQPKIDDIKGLTQWINFLWLKLKDLFSDESATTNDNYLPKIDDIDKKLVKSNIQDDGTTPKYGANTIWHSGNDGSTSGLDADTLDGKHLADLVQYIVNPPMTYKYVPFDDPTSFGWKSGSGLIITMYQNDGTNAFGVSDSYDCLELFECVHSPSTKADVDTGVWYPNPVDNAKIAKRNIWTDSPDVKKYRHKITEGIFGSIGNISAYNNLSTWLNIGNNGVAGYALKNNSSIFTDLSGGTSYSLNLTYIVDNMKIGMNYTFVGRAVGSGVVPFDLRDSRGSSFVNLTIDQIISFDFIKVADGVAIYRNLEIR